MGVLSRRHKLGRRWHWSSASLCNGQHAAIGDDGAGRLFAVRKKMGAPFPCHHEVRNYIHVCHESHYCIIGNSIPCHHEVTNIFCVTHFIRQCINIIFVLKKHPYHSPSRNFCNLSYVTTNVYNASIHLTKSLYTPVASWRHQSQNIWFYSTHGDFFAL